MRLSFVATAVSLSLIGLSAAGDVGATIRKPVDIPAQQLESALQALAKDHEFQVIYRTEIVGQRRSNGVIGDLTSSEALDRMLDKTGLTYQYLDDHTVTILPLPVARDKKSNPPAAIHSTDLTEATPRANAARGVDKPASFWDRFRIAQANQEALPGSSSETARGDEPSDRKPDPIEEILVTARKRTESLQDVPLSVSVLDGLSLQANQIETVDDLYARIPGLYFTNGGGVTANSDFIYLTLRGVGFNGGQEPATGVFIDGMYQPQLGYDIDFLDLDRLEVLRGPQGTLFGRNTEAGAINLVTRKPDRELAGRMEAEGARFDTYRAFISVNGPITDTLFGGISGQFRSTDGYIKNTPTDEPRAWQRRSAVRGVLRWLPSDELELNLAADFSHRVGTEMDFGSLLGCRCYDVRKDPQPDNSQDMEGIQLNAEWRPSTALTFTSITGFRRVKTDSFSEFDGVLTDQTSFVANGLPNSSVIPPTLTLQGDLQELDTDQKFWSEELRLAGNSSAVNWLTGAYYFKQKQGNFAQQVLGPGVVTDPLIAFLVPLVDLENFKADRDGWALFAQTSWRPIERLELTGGGRYSRETSSIDGFFFINFVQFQNAAPTFFTAFADKTFNNFSPTVSLSWQLAPPVKGYATVSRGWKAGGFNRYPSTAEAAVLPYDAETSTNYEVGLKSAWPENHVTANLALFYIDIKDQQLFTTTNDPNGVPVSTITNAGKSRSQGAELELFAQPVQRLDLSLSLAYTDTKFTDFTQRASDGSFVVRDGEHFEFVPLMMGSASVQYRLPIGVAKDLEMNVSYRYVNEYVVPDVSLFAPLGGRIPVNAYDRLDLRATYALRDWKISGYLHNVLNSFDYTNKLYRPFVMEAPATLLVTPLEPRTYGLVVSKAF